MTSTSTSEINRANRAFVCIQPNPSIHTYVQPHRAPSYSSNTAVLQTAAEARAPLYDRGTSASTRCSTAQSRCSPGSAWLDRAYRQVFRAVVLEPRWSSIGHCRLSVEGLRWEIEAPRGVDFSHTVHTQQHSETLQSGPLFCFSSGVWCVGFPQRTVGRP